MTTTLQQINQIKQLWTSTYLGKVQIGKQVGLCHVTVSQIIKQNQFQRLCKNCRKQRVGKGRFAFCCNSCKLEYHRDTHQKYRGWVTCQVCGKKGAWFNVIHTPRGKKVGERVQHWVKIYSHKKYVAAKKAGKKKQNIYASVTKPTKACIIPKPNWTP